ncbi:MAG TPA: hypothetical protein VN457_07645 [Chlamydiales bacterium]|nr:hypothetical protein [Chlamydiales bacterium]
MTLHLYTDLPVGAYAVCKFQWPKEKLTARIQQLHDAIDSTEKLYEVIDKTLGPQSIGEKQTIVQELIEGFLQQLIKKPSDSLWKQRILHLLGQYLLIMSGFLEFTMIEREQLAQSNTPFVILADALQPLPTQTIDQLCKVLGTNKKMLLLALIIETQKPQYNDWPEMVNLLTTTQAWAHGRIKNQSIDHLYNTLFPT